jgi:hypothetical protein
MSWKRRWGIVGILVLAQVGIIVCYQGVLTGNAAPAAAQEQKPAPQAVPPAEGKELREAIPATSEPPPPGEKVEPKAVAPAPLAQSVDLIATPVEAVPAVPTPPRTDEKVRQTGGQAPPDSLPPIALPPVDKDKAEVKPQTRPPETHAPPMGAAETAPAPRFFKMPAPGTPGAPAPLDDKTVKQVGGATPPEGDQKPAPGAPPTKPSAPAPSLLPSPPAPPGNGGTDTPTRPTPPPVAADPPRPADPLVAPAVPTQTTEPPAPDAPCPWVLRVEIVKGRTLMTAQSGKEVQFRVSCDKLDMQAPRGSILASGNVTVSSEGLEGSCHQLMIAWQADQVILEGKAELKCRREGQEVDLKASRLSLRLSVSHNPDEPRKASLIRGKAATESRDWISRGKQGAVQGVRPVGTMPMDTNPGVVAPARATQTYDRYYGDSRKQ